MTRHTGLAAGAGLSVILALTTAVAAQSSSHSDGGQANPATGAIAATAEPPAVPAARAAQDQADQSVTPPLKGGAQAAGLQPAPLQPAATREEAGPMRRIDHQREQFERDIRLMMARYGFAGDDTQTALIDYIAGEEEARRPLRQIATRLVRALNQTDIPDDKMRSVLMRYRNLLDADKMRREKAQAALDARINYSQNPRLESMLLLFGVIGDGKFMILPAPPPPAAVPVHDGGYNYGTLVAEPPGRAAGFAGGLPMANGGSERVVAAPTVNITPALQAQAEQVQGVARAANVMGANALRAVAVERNAAGDAFGLSLYSELLKRFDTNGNKQLDPEERTQALSFFKTLLETRDSRQVLVLAGTNTGESANPATNGLVEVSQSSTSNSVIETHTSASMPPKK